MDKSNIESNEIALAQKIGQTRIAVAGYEGRYTIDRDSNVYSLLRGGEPKRLTSTICSDGYYRINLYDGLGGAKMIAVHRMVALAFLPLDVSRLFVNHKNGIKTDNRIDNLEWCTLSENMRHAVRIGLHRAPSIPDPEMVATAKYMRRAGVTFKVIGEHLGCGIATAYAYVNRTSADPL